MVKPNVQQSLHKKNILSIIKMKYLYRSWFILFIAILFISCNKVYFNQLPTFDPRNIKNIAILTDFISIHGDIIQVGRSKYLADELTERVSERLKEKKYILSPIRLTSVGSYFLEKKKVSHESKYFDPPFYIDSRLDINRTSKEALISSFKMIDEYFRPYKANLEKIPFQKETLSLKEKTRVISELSNADYLLLLYAQEIWMTASERIQKSLMWGAIGGAIGISMYLAPRNWVESSPYLTPRWATAPVVIPVGFACGFLVELITGYNAYTSINAVLIEKNTGNAVWFGFAKEQSGGISGNMIKTISKEIIEKIPEWRKE
jgi:hypothetical protein